MKALLVTATIFEVAPFLSEVGLLEGNGDKISAGTLLTNRTIDCLITGVGQLQCGVHVAEALCNQNTEYSFLLQAGLCGSFSGQFAKRAVVNISKESLADLGAESSSSPLDLFEMGLMDAEVAPFADGALFAPPLTRYSSLQALPLASSVTVNRVLSHAASIDWVRSRYQPDVVNMEGASFFYVALRHNIPFASIRAVSDYVGPRDKSAWDIPGSIVSLNLELSKWWATI